MLVLVSRHKRRIFASLVLSGAPLMPIMIHSSSALVQTDELGNALWNARRIPLASATVSSFIGGQNVAMPPGLSRLFMREKNSWGRRLTEPATLGGGGSPEIISYCRGLAVRKKRPS